MIKSKQITVLCDCSLRNVHWLCLYFMFVLHQTVVNWEDDKLVCVQKGEKKNRGWTHWIHGDELHLVWLVFILVILTLQLVFVMRNILSPHNFVIISIILCNNPNPKRKKDTIHVIVWSFLAFYSYHSVLGHFTTYILVILYDIFSPQELTCEDQVCKQIYKRTLWSCLLRELQSTHCEEMRLIKKPHNIAHILIKSM